MSHPAIHPICEHRDYTGRRPPRTECVTCWVFYVATNPGIAALKMRAMRTVGNDMAQLLDHYDTVNGHELARAWAQAKRGQLEE